MGLVTPEQILCSYEYLVVPNKPVENRPILGKKYELLYIPHMYAYHRNKQPYVTLRIIITIQNVFIPVPWLEVINAGTDT